MLKNLTTALLVATASAELTPEQIEKRTAKLQQQCDNFVALYESLSDSAKDKYFELEVSAYEKCKGTVTHNFFEEL